MKPPASFFERHLAQLSYDDQFDRAATGATVPSLADLIQGCPFYKDHIWCDADTFAQFATDQMATLDDGNTSLLFALAELTVAPGLADYLHAAEQLQASVGTPLGDAVSAKRGAARCHLYAAISGHAESAKHVAAFAISPAGSDDLPANCATLHAQGTLAWMMAAIGQLSVPAKWTRQTAAEFLASADCSGSTGRQVLERIVAIRPEVTRGAWKLDVPRPVRIRSNPPAPHEPDTRDTEFNEHSDDGADATKDDSPRAVVMTAVGNPTSSEGRRVAAEFKSVTGTALSLVRLPDLAGVRRKLMTEFPHAEEVTDTILAAMPGSAHVRVPPTVLVGPPGTGKSSYAVRLAELLGLPTEVFPCGGVSDAALAGTPRRWSTGEPSIPVSVIRAHECASPAIILDEIEKVAASKSNGSLLDALLGLLERRTAERWRDPYVEAAVDLSHVVWLGTANDMVGVSRALLDRCRVIAFPSPGAAHIPALARGILGRFAAERGLDPRWLTSLDGVELGVGIPMKAATFSNLIPATIPT